MQYVAVNAVANGLRKYVIYPAIGLALAAAIYSGVACGSKNSAGYEHSTIPTPTATYAPITATAPTQTGNFILNFDASVSDSEKDYIIRSLNNARSYYAASLGVDLEKDATIEVGAGNSIHAAGVRGHQMRVNTTSRRFLSSTPELRAKILAHEYFHILQNELVNIEGGHRGAYWLWEGTAEFLAYKAVENVGMISYVSYDRVRTYHVNNAKQLPPLIDLESESALLSTDTDYSLGVLAVELLATNHGVGSLRDYFKNLAADNWRDAFEKAFDESVDSFYQRFENHRKGF